ncbi:MAG: trigger factor [Spirochaetes bacterium]|nr:trigger factor [Spirochaetota bacterium]
MKVDAKIINEEKASVVLEIEVDKESISEEYNSILQKYQKQASIPGFRKGKAPEAMVKKRFKNNIDEDVLSDIIPKAYTEALEITKVAPYTVPEIKVESFNEKELKFKADVQLRPEVELGTYKGLSFHQDEYKISDKDIDNELHKLQERFADFVNKDDKKIADEDNVVLQVEAYNENNEIIKELSNENHKLEVNKKNLYDEFYRNIIGLKVNDDNEFSKEYPRDFNNKMLAGKKILYKIKIKEVQEKKLPGIDDKFAKDVGDYKSLDELKKVIEDQLKGILDNHISVRLEKSMLEKISHASKYRIPERLIADRSATLLNDFQKNLKQQGHDFNSMIEQKIIDLEKIKAEVRTQSLKDLEDYLIIMKIIELESIKVEEKEVDDFISKEAQNMKQDVNEYKKKLSQDMLSYIKQDLLTKKVLTFLKENNKIKKGKTHKMEDLMKESGRKK